MRVRGRAGPSLDGLGSLALVVGVVLTGTVALATVVPAAAAAPQGPPTDWQNETVSQGTAAAMSPSVAVDAEGHPHVVYQDTSKGSLKYAEYDGSGWQIRTVDSKGATGYGADIELDADGHPHVVYLGNGVLRYAEWDGSAWQTRTAVSNVKFGASISFALDANGNPHVSYYERGGKDLEYATHNGVSWVTTEVATSGDIGEFNAIAVDGTGTPHIAYHDTTNGDLEYAVKLGGSWSTQTLDSSGTVGLRPSIAVTDGGVPHVSYYDRTNRDLKYAVVDGTPHVEPVDAGGAVGQTSSIVVDRTGDPHIAYTDAANGDLEYAEADGRGWTGGTVATKSTVGYFPSLALDAGGSPVIAHLRMANWKADVVVTQRRTVPTAPESVSATAGDERVSLSWDAPEYDGRAAITGYEIHRDDGSGLTKVATVSGTSYTDTGLTNGQGYDYVVRAVNTVGTGSASERVSATPLGEPDAPVSLGASAGDERISLSWDAPNSTGGSPIRTYAIYRVVGGSKERIGTVSRTDYTVEDLRNGQSYVFAVAAINAEGEGPLGSSVTATPQGPPGAPGSVQAKTNGSDDGEVVLEWTAPDDDGGSRIVDYRIYRATGDGSMTRIGTVAAGTTSYEDTAVTPGTTYSYEVRAVNANGEGAAGTTSVDLPAPDTDTPDTDTAATEADDAGDDGARDGSGSGLPLVAFAAGLVGIGVAAVAIHELRE